MRLGLVVLSFAALGSVLGTASAQAEPICASVTVEGTVTGTRQFGPYCVPYPFTVACSNQQLGLEPTVVVTAAVCSPP